MSISGLTTVDIIKAIRKELFEKEFDIDAFTDFLYEHFARNQKLVIGFEHDKPFEKWIHKHKQTYTPKRFCKWIAYERNHDCGGHLYSNVQIPLRFSYEMEHFLKENGFDKIEKHIVLDQLSALVVKLY